MPLLLSSYAGTLRRQNPFLQVFSMSDKPRLDQLKIITGTRSTSFSESFHLYKDRKISARKGKYPVLGTNMKSQKLIEHAKISYSIDPQIFCKCSCGTYLNGINRGTSKLRHSKYLKKYGQC